MIINKLEKITLNHCIKAYGVIKLFFSLFINVKYLYRLLRSKPTLNKLYFLSNFQSSILIKLIDIHNLSKSQINQDLMVLAELNFKSNGFFVEFGAADGISLSNTFLLEKTYGWSGVLAEPNINNKDKLLGNRKSIIDLRCVTDKSHKTIDFFVANDSLYSVSSKYMKESIHEDKLKNGNYTKVETVSLNDLLDQHNAPLLVDYLSIDTEGSEFQILSNLNFNKYKFLIITVEHNFTSARDKIFNLLTNKGYKRKYTNLSKFDDWYFLEENKK